MKLLIMIYRLATYLYLLSENAIEDQHNIELVDVEQNVWPKTKRPSLLPAGSAGYAPKYLTSGVWQKKPIDLLVLFY